VHVVVPFLTSVANVRGHRIQRLTGSKWGLGVMTAPSKGADRWDYRRSSAGWVAPSSLIGTTLTRPP